jgi:hypothetical protein
VSTSESAFTFAGILIELNALLPESRVLRHFFLEAGTGVEFNEVA